MDFLSDVDMTKLAKPKKLPRGKMFVKGQIANPRGRPPGPTKFTRELKIAILNAAESVGEDGKGKDGLQGFLVREAKKKDNRGFMMLLGKVLPLTIAGDKNRPLEVISRIELVRAEGSSEQPRDVTPMLTKRGPVIDGKASEPPPAPLAPVVAKAPGRSGA